MPPIPRDTPEQEHSIKARGSELYAKLDRERPQVKPFEVYLRETPAEPIGAGAMTALWAAGIIVVVLFGTALWRISHRGPRRPIQPAARKAAPAAKLGERARQMPLVSTTTLSERWSRS